MRYMIKQGNQLEKNIEYLSFLCFVNLELYTLPSTNINDQKMVIPSLIFLQINFS